MRQKRKMMGLLCCFTLIAAYGLYGQGLSADPAPGANVTRDEFDKLYNGVPVDLLSGLSTNTQIDLYLWKYAGSNLYGMGISNWSGWARQIAESNGERIVLPVIQRIRQTDVATNTIVSNDTAILLGELLINLLSQPDVRISNEQSSALVGTLERTSVAYLLAQRRVVVWIGDYERIIELCLGITRKGTWIASSVFEDAARQKYTAMGIHILPRGD